MQNVMLWIQCNIYLLKYLRTGLKLNQTKYAQFKNGHDAKSNKTNSGSPFSPQYCYDPTNGVPEAYFGGQYAAPPVTVR